MTTARHVAIVGAGPAGLTVGRALKRAGIPFTIVERHTGVGGIWDIENPGGPMYDSAHFISSSRLSHFAGHPMPAGTPDYPGHRRVLRYVRSFAREEGLLAHVRFGTSVVQTERSAEGWRLELAAGEPLEASHLVCASGTTWAPRLPEWPGSFAGTVMHSSAYRSRELFAGRRVLVVGAGNSGCDIACDAAQTADAAFISMRRGYHFIPKHLFGMPADVFSARTAWLPMAVRRRAFEAVLKRVHGDLGELGLPAPDHRVLESHPILNDQLLHHLRHGDVEVHRDVERLDGTRVRFVDGRSVEVDLVVCATGYATETPYLAPGTFPERGGRPDLYLNMLSREDPTLFASGFLESNSGLFKLFDHKAHVIAHAIAAEGNAARKLRALAERDVPDLSGGIRYVKSARHATYVNIDAYRRALHRLARRMGWPGFEPRTLFPDAPAFRAAPALLPEGS
ncbi:MAG: NAD(P)/FAD-dependent oxidoreductase [Myxococcota bacterium]